MTVNRIDTDTLDTAAIRALADAEENLLDAIATMENGWTVTAEQMTIAELKAALDSPVTGNPNKATLIARYVKQRVAATETAQQLKQLKKEARRDEKLASQLNMLLDRSDAADAKIREAAASHSGRAMYDRLRWVLDEAFTDQIAATWARRVLKEMADGADLRDAVMSVLAAALDVIFDFPSGHGANGSSSVLKAEHLFQAKAAVEFRNAVLMPMDRDSTIPLDMIKF